MAAIIKDVFLSPTVLFNDTVAGQQDNHVKNMVVSEKHRIIVVVVENLTGWDTGHVKVYDLDTFRCITNSLFTYKPIGYSTRVDVCIDNELDILELLINSNRNYNRSCIMRYSINKNREKILHKITGRIKMKHAWTQLKTYHVTKESVPTQKEMIRITYGDIPGHDHYFSDYHGNIIFKMNEPFATYYTNFCFLPQRRWLYFIVCDFGGGFLLRRYMLNYDYGIYNSLETGKYQRHEGHSSCHMSVSEKWDMIFVTCSVENSIITEMFIFNLNFDLIKHNRHTSIKRIVPLDTGKELKVLIVNVYDSVCLVNINLHVKIPSLRQMCIHQLKGRGISFPEYLKF
jgi:hypothetical protein